MSSLRRLATTTGDGKSISMKAKEIDWSGTFVNPFKTTSKCYTFNPSPEAALIQKLTITGLKTHELLVYLHMKNQVKYLLFNEESCP